MAYSIERQRPPVEKANLEDTVCQEHGQRLHILDSRASKPAARRFGRCRWQGSGEAGHGLIVRKLNLVEVLCHLEVMLMSNNPSSTLRGR